MLYIQIIEENVNNLRILSWLFHIVAKPEKSSFKISKTVKVYNLRQEYKKLER